MSDIDEYLKKVEPSQKMALERIRKTIKQIAPDAEEVISYGIPGFKYNGKYLIGYAAFKGHMSIFPTSAPVHALKEKLGDFEISKGTIQFTNDNPIPESIIMELIAVRMRSIKKN